MTSLAMPQAMNTDAPSVLSPARSAPNLLLINGLLLAAVGAVQLAFDLAGAFLGIGPVAALHGNPAAIGLAEAHGLALILGIVLVLKRNAGGATWHWTAAAVHALLGGANLMFWSSFEAYGLVPMGLAATIGHGLLVAAELGFAFAITPGTLTGPGTGFRVATLGTLGTGILLHMSTLPLGRTAFLERIFTPTFDAFFAVPMTLAGVLGVLLYRRAIFDNGLQRVAYLFMLAYFLISIVVHLRTLVTWDTSYVLAFPAWYSIVVLPLMLGLAVLTIRQRFRP